MNVGGIQNALIGMALFDMWEAAIQKGQAAGKTSGSPLVDAAVKAFEGYLSMVEQQNASMIAGVAVYALNPQGNGAQAITAKDLAPFLALNVMA